MTDGLNSPDRVVRYRTDGPVAYITFNRPEVRNAMTTESYIQLLDVLRMFLADDALQVVIFTGEGEKAFNAGGDLKEHNGVPPEWWSEHDFPPFPLLELNDLLWHCPKVVISAINGHCAGWGMVLLGVSDFRISVPEAKFGYVGAVKVFGGAGAQVPERLIVQIPYVKAMEMLLGSRMLTAEEALEYDFLTEIVSRADLMDAAGATAEKCLEISPRGIRIIKEAVRRVQAPAIAAANEGTLREAREHVRSADFIESMSAWSESRAAKWEGK
jgi:enoyl-CoA hydratase